MRRRIRDTTTTSIFEDSVSYMWHRAAHLALINPNDYARAGIIRGTKLIVGCTLLCGPRWVLVRVLIEVSTRNERYSWTRKVAAAAHQERLLSHSRGCILCGAFQSLRVVRKAYRSPVFQFRWNVSVVQAPKLFEYHPKRASRLNELVTET